VRGDAEQEIKELERRIDKGKERERGLIGRLIKAERRAEERKERLKEAETGGLNTGYAGTEGEDIRKSKGKGEKRGGIRIIWTSREFRRKKAEIKIERYFKFCLNKGRF